ncbi:MAG: hypothetical protein ACOCUL_05110 [Bacteroidota bacterium]
MKTKMDYMQEAFTKEELKNIDVAIPLAFQKRLEEMNIPRFFYVWDYNNDKIGGEPVHLLEKIDEKNKSSELPEVKASEINQYLDNDGIIRWRSESGEAIPWEYLSDIFSAGAHQVRIMEAKGWTEGFIHCNYKGQVYIGRFMKLAPQDSEDFASQKELKTKQHNC